MDLGIRQGVLFFSIFTFYLVTNDFGVVTSILGIYQCKISKWREGKVQLSLNVKKSKIANFLCNSRLLPPFTMNVKIFQQTIRWRNDWGVSLVVDRLGTYLGFQ